MAIAYEIGSALAYTALVAYWSAWLSSRPGVTFSLGYALGGFAFTYEWLGRMAMTVGRRRRDPGNAAAATGAGLGMIVALGLYPALFASPHVVFAFPGVWRAYRYAFGVYELLREFWIVWLASAVVVFVMLVQAAREAWRGRTTVFAMPWRALGLSPVFLWLRGWLLVVAVLVIGTPIWLMAQISSTVDLARDQTLNLHWLWQPLILGDLTGALVLIMWSCVLLVTFFARQPTFPGVAAGFLGAHVVLALADVAVGLGIAGGAMTTVEIGGLVRALLIAVVGVAYLRRSRRVAATFRRLPAATA